MFRIAIVDDESYVRMGLKIIAEKEGRYTVAGEADNGPSAVRMILQQQPDAVFLDITIPGLDGLEVLQEIRQQGYSGHVTMLTCHDEFRFAQQALRLGADDYVLKNDLAGDSFSLYLDKLRTSLSSIGETPPQEEAQTALQCKNNFLKNILYMGCTDRETFLRGCANHHIRFKPNGIYILTLHFRHWESIVARYKSSDLHVFFRAVDAIVREVLQNQAEWEGLYTDPYLYHILFSNSQEPSSRKLEEQLNNMVKRLAFHFERMLEVDTAIVVYRSTYPPETLNLGYAMACQLLEQSWFHPEKKLFWEGVLLPRQEAELNVLALQLEEANEPEKMERVVREWLTSQGNAFIDHKAFKEVLREPLNQMDRLYPGAAGLCLSDCASITEMLHQLSSLRPSIPHPAGKNEYSYLVNQALSLMNRSLREKASVEDIAGSLGISAGYFSHIFSEEVGESFSRYMIRQRIEKARQLILTTNLKYYEIAEQCGFSSPVHFNNTFKKLCGMTPNQYRNNGKA